MLEKLFSCYSWRPLQKIRHDFLISSWDWKESSGHTLYLKPWDLRVFISNKPYSRSQVLASVNHHKSADKQKGDVKLWRQAYLLGLCQLPACHRFCSLSLRHLLKFLPKAKAHGVAGPKGEKRKGQAIIQEALLKGGS